MMAVRWVVVFAALFLGSCQLPGSGSGCTSQIDWVDFIQVGSTQYLAGLGSPPTIQESDLGPVYAHVKFKVSGNVCDPNYRLKDGDAAFLEPGTSIYQVSGYSASERLAARRDGRIEVYEAKAPT